MNPADWYAMMGIPWVARPTTGLRRPRSNRPGLDLAGVVAAVGGNVTRFQPGDEVFGTGTGTLAECVAVPEDALVAKPARLSFEQAAAVCSTRNVDMAGSLGADRVVDYTREDFTRGDRRYDLLLDVAGSRPWSACRRVLTPKARMVLVGAPKGSRLLGPLDHIARVGLGEGHAQGRLAVTV